MPVFLIQSADKQGVVFRVVLGGGDEPEPKKQYLALFGAKFVDGLVAAAGVKTFDEVVGKAVVGRVGCLLAPGNKFTGYVLADSFEKVPK